MISKKQLIQLLQFILARILLWLFVTFVMEEWFINFILKHRFYLLIVSCSYFYYNSIEYEPDKKYKLIRNIILYWNIYLFLHVFFRPLLNISHQLFVLLWLITLWLRWTSKLKSKRKYLLQIIWRIFSFFILISWMFYFYPDKPDIQWFFQSNQTKIRILWANDTVKKKDAYIQIKSSKETNDFEIVPWFNKVLTENVKISYPSLKSQRDENLILETAQWDIIWIFPQSEIQIELKWKELKNIKKINWRIWFLSWIFDSNLKITGDLEILDQKQQERIQWIQHSYKYELVSHLKNQISESNISWANNTIMYNIDGQIIWFLAKLFPVSFSKNLRNYNEFQEYFSWIDTWVDLGRYEMKQWSWWNINSILWNIKDNINIWKNNTYGRFRKPEKK